MSQKTFGKQLTVVDTKSRVKMHKSGKKLGKNSNVAF